MIKSIFNIIIYVLIFTACKPSVRSDYEVVIPSSDRNVRIHFNLFKGEPYYMVGYNNNFVVGWSRIGFLNSNDTISLIENLLVDGIVKESKPLQDVYPFDDDGTYNLIRISMHNRHLAEMKFDVVFGVNDKRVVYWYEYDPSLLTKFPGIVEYNEFDLYPESHRWLPADPISMSDTLFYPATFVSDAGVKLTYTEQISGRPVDGYLLNRNRGVPEFLGYHSYDENLVVNEKQSNKIISSIKFIQIQNK